MAQNEIAEIKLAEGGGSSAMPHKSNPVRAEVLVALARFNAALIAAQHQALIHENERSGAAWTLEWLILPQMVVATGAALRHAAALCAGTRFVAE
jgi:3-carboxy-cis,cis-muconate cycloisomerase